MEVNPGAFDGVVMMGDGVWKLKEFEVEVGVTDRNPDDSGGLNVGRLLGTDPSPNEGGAEADFN